VIIFFRIKISDHLFGNSSNNSKFYTFGEVVDSDKKEVVFASVFRKGPSLCMPHFAKGNYKCMVIRQVDNCQGVVGFEQVLLCSLIIMESTTSASFTTLFMYFFGGKGSAQ